MEYCNTENINPTQAFGYLHQKMPLNSLTEWQAFCQLRGVLRSSRGFFWLLFLVMQVDVAIGSALKGLSMDENSEENSEDDSEEDGDEPSPASPASGDKLDPTDPSFEYNPTDPALLKDAHQGLHQSKDKDAYSVLLGRAQAAGKEKAWRTDLIVAAKRGVDTMLTNTLTQRKSTGAQNRAHRNATIWVCCICF
jgi:hypothetical protein